MFDRVFKVGVLVLFAAFLGMIVVYWFFPVPRYRYVRGSVSRDVHVVVDRWTGTIYKTEGTSSTVLRFDRRLRRRFPKQ
ncbi:MAG: hypothetical protein KJ621_02770 [Proteobacteria bacterium]|nr:hypothetical protein [Pseudomonadota bacterium]